MNSYSKQKFKSYQEEILDGSCSQQGLPSDIVQGHQPEEYQYLHIERKDSSRKNDKQREMCSDAVQNSEVQSKKPIQTKKKSKKIKKGQYMEYQSLQVSEMLMKLFRQHSALEDSKDDIEQWLRQISDRLCLPQDYVTAQYNKYDKNNIGVYEQKTRRRRYIAERRSQSGVYRKTQKFDNAIKAVLKQIPFACISDLKDQICKKEGLQLRKQTLIRRLKKIGYKYQKYCVRKVSSNKEDQKMLRRMYVSAIGEIRKRGEDILYLGECKFTPEEFRGNMWMKVSCEGQPQVRVEDADLLVMVMIVSKNKLQYSRIFQGSYSRSKFTTALQQWAMQLHHHTQPQNSCNQQPKSIYCGNIHLAVQSSPIHHAKIIVDNSKNLQNGQQFHDETRLMLAKYSIGLIYIPSFSSQLNPAEVIFNTIKYNVRESKPKNVTDIKNAILKVVNNKIDRQDIKFGFQDLQKFHTLASQLKDFT